MPKDPSVVIAQTGCVTNMTALIAKPLSSTHAIWKCAWSKMRADGCPRPADIVVGRGLAYQRDRLVQLARKVQATRQQRQDLSLEQRLKTRLEERYSQEIEARGGETHIQEKTRVRPLRLIERRGNMVLLGCEGWRHYSSRTPARFVSLRYLCGVDDNGPWAVRVHGTNDTIAAALTTLEPREVARARAEGRQVLRQGDVYVVQMIGGRDNFRALDGTSHHWDTATRLLTHDDDRAAHDALYVPFKPAKAILQNGLGMGRLPVAGGRGRDRHSD